MKNKRVKVLIIGSHSSVKGGITSVINMFLKHKWENVEVELLATYIELSTFKKMIFFTISVIKLLSKLVKNSFDIIHIHMSYKGSFFRKYIIVKLSNLFKKKIILHLHGSEFAVFYNNSNKVVKKLIQDIFKKSNSVIVLGQNWEKIVKSIVPEAKTVVINNAINIPNYKVKWNDERINILFLGVLIQRKGIYDLLDAIKILNDKGIVKDKNLNFIIGGSGSEELKIKKTIEQYDLLDCIEMVGWVNGEKKEELLKKSQLFVLPSYNEGLPMAILEAISYGIPVIGTNVGSINEAITNGESGILINPNKKEEIVSSILKLVENRECWEMYSDKSKELACNKFNEKKYFKEFENLYFK